MRKTSDFGESSGESGNHKKRRMRWVLLVIELAILAFVVALLYVELKVERINKADISAENLQISEENSSDSADAAMDRAEKSQSDSTDSDVPTTSQDQYREIALFGVDSLEGELSQKTRSDSIMILCINETKNEAKTCLSLSRYPAQPGGRHLQQMQRCVCARWPGTGNPHAELQL